MTLVTHDREGRLVGEAASRWEVSPDLKVFSFTLTEGVRDSEGRVLDSGDWRATLLHLLRSGGSTHSFISQFLDESGIETPSPDRLVLHLKKPYQTFMQRLTTPEFILIPRNAIDEKNAVDLRRSSGAYRLKSLDAKTKACTLAANPFYFKKQPGQIDEIVLEPLPATSAAMYESLASRKWSFSIARPIPTDPAMKVLENLVHEKKIVSEPTRPNSVGFVLFLDSPRVAGVDQRMALGRVIGESADRDMSRPPAAAAHQIYPPGFVGALSPDDEAALYQGVVRRGGAAALPKMIVGYASSGSYAVGAAQWVRDAFVRAGVDVDAHEISYAAYPAKQKGIDHDYMVVMTGMNAKDPAGSLLTLLSPKSGIIPDADGKLNSLLQKAVEADSSERPAILREVSTRLLKEARIVPFVFHGSAIISSPDLIARPPSMYDDELRLADIRWRD